MNPDFQNPANQAEKQEVLRNERLRPGDQQPSTFHQMANLDTSLGGRFSAGGYVNGSEPAVNYPAGPAWTRDQVGIEPPLGVAIDDLEPRAMPTRSNTPPHKLPLRLCPSSTTDNRLTFLPQPRRAQGGRNVGMKTALRPILQPRSAWR